MSLKLTKFDAKSPFELILSGQTLPLPKHTQQRRAVESSVPPFEQVPEQQAGPPTYVTPFPPNYVGIPSQIFNGYADYQLSEWHRRRAEHQRSQQWLSDTNPWIIGQHKTWIAPPPTSFIGDLSGQNRPKLKWRRKHLLGNTSQHISAH